MTHLTLTRRQFAQFIVLGGLGLTFASCDRGAARRPLSPNWWLELYADGAIRLLTSRVEMGQGAHTGLRTLLAEELDVEPNSLQIVQVPSDPRYGEIITGGSFTLAGWQERMRRAGATARHMLVQAAAQRWNVPVAEIATQAGELRHFASGRRAPYRDLVAAAASSSPPAAELVQLKAPSDWRYIGKTADRARTTRRLQPALCVMASTCASPTCASPFLRVRQSSARGSCDSMTAKRGECAASSKRLPSPATRGRRSIIIAMPLPSWRAIHGQHRRRVTPCESNGISVRGKSSTPKPCSQRLLVSAPAQG